MPTKKPIVMGNKVIDVMTGFTGHVVAISERPHSTIMYGVQPPAKKGATEYPKAIYIDGYALDVTGKGFAGRLPEIDKSVTISLGDKVEDTVTGLIGIVVERMTFQNGCVHLYVVGRLHEDKEEPPTVSAQHTRFKLVEKVAKPTIDVVQHMQESLVPEPDPEPYRPGGPAREVIRP